MDTRFGRGYFDASCSRDRLTRGPAPRRADHFLFSRPRRLSRDIAAMADKEACVDCNPVQQPAPTVSTEPATAAAAQADQYNPLLDPTTFVPPSPSIRPSITIEFCDRVTILIANILTIISDANESFTVSLVR